MQLTPNVESMSTDKLMPH